MENNPKILISIINWNNYPLTDKCINSVLQNDYKNFKIVLIDNASIDNSFEQLFSKFSNNKNIKLIKSNENLGFAAGHLEAIKSENIDEYEAIWLLNNDLTIKKDALQKLVSFYIKTPNNVLGSVVLTHENKIGFAGVPENSTEQYKNIYSRYTEEPYEGVKHLIKTEDVKGINGASYFLPTSVYNQVGFIPTYYFMYYEEEDYNRTLKNNNIKRTLVHDSIVYHNVGYSSYLGKKIPCVLNYYKTRNSKFLSKKIYGYSRRNYLYDCWGIIPYFRAIFYKTISKLTTTNINYFNKYMINMGIFHFYTGKMEKIFEPNDYLG